MRKSTKRVRAATSDGYVRTSMVLPASLHQRLMFASLETRLVATEIARRALERWLRTYERRGGAR